jgi:hypothetical protein
MSCKGNPLNLPTKCINENELQDLRYDQKKYIFNNNANISIPGYIVEKHKKHNENLAAQQEPIPENWNWMVNDADIINRGTLDQGQCGSCWAFSLAMVLSDCYAIKYSIKNPNLSPLWLLTCSNNENTESPVSNILVSNFAVDNSEGCCGGNNYIGAKWLEKNKKIGTLNCWPTTNPNLYYNTSISNNCLDKSQIDCSICNQNNLSKSSKFGVKEGSTRYLVSYDCTGNVPKININQTIINIKREIMSKGPVLANYIVPPDFNDWWNNTSLDSIYKNTKYDITNSNQGHAVALLGWGNKNGVDFWIMRNSWGQTHDGVGYCYMAMTTTNDNPKYYTGLDIPIPSNTDGCNPISWRGGTVSIEADDINILSQEWQNYVSDPKNKVKLNLKPTGKGAIDFGNHLNINWKFYVIIGISVLIVLILLFSLI